MKKICFIGAPGAGKSTLYNALINGVGQREWLTSIEAKLAVGKLNPGSMDSDIKQRLLRLIFLRGVFFREKYSVISDYILKKIIYESFDSMRLVYEPLFDMAYKGLDSEVKDPVSRMLVSAFFIKLAKDEMLLNYYNPDKTVVFDDSMWQSIRGVKKYFNSITDKEFISRMPHPDAVVHFFTSAERIFAQIKKRRSDGKLNTSHYSLSDDELYESIKNDLENSRFKTELFERAGIRILKINTASEIHENLILVNDFINQQV